MDVIKEIKAHSNPADQAVLIWLFERYHGASHWKFVSRCDWVQYGKLSTDWHRVWTPTVEGVCVYNALKDKA